MFKYGMRSERCLNTSHKLLRTVFEKTLEKQLIDIAVIFGYRDETEQNNAHNSGNSKVTFPNSKHNIMPSNAVDAFPVVNGNISYNYYHCCFLAGIVMATAAELGIKIRWGGNWDQDGEPITDQTFNDLGHYEIAS